MVWYGMAWCDFVWYGVMWCAYASSSKETNHTLQLLFYKALSYNETEKGACSVKEAFKIQIGLTFNKSQKWLYK